MEFEIRYYRLISWKGISEPMKLQYLINRVPDYELNLEKANRPIILDCSTRLGGARKISFQGSARRLFFFNAKRQCIHDSWAYQNYSIPEDTAWLIFAPKAWEQNFQPLAIGAWSYSDNPSATRHAAIEYQWYTYNSFHGLRFKLLDSIEAKWILSPELLDLVDEATMCVDEDQRVPLFTVDKELDRPALYRSITANDGQLFAILFTGSSENALALYRSYGDELSPEIMPPKARHLFFAGNHLEEDRLHARFYFEEALKLSVIERINDLELAITHYLQQWRKYGGGTKGHAIGSTLKRMEELNKFFKRYC